MTKIKLLKNIWEPADEDGPSGYLGWEGEVLELVNYVEDDYSPWAYEVRHEGRDGSFLIASHEGQVIEDA